MELSLTLWSSREYETKLDDLKLKRPWNSRYLTTESRYPIAQGILEPNSQYPEAQSNLRENPKGPGDQDTLEKSSRKPGYQELQAHSPRDYGTKLDTLGALSKLKDQDNPELKALWN